MDDWTGSVYRQSLRKPLSKLLTAPIRKLQFCAEALQGAGDLMHPRISKFCIGDQSKFCITKKSPLSIGVEAWDFKRYKWGEALSAVLEGRLKSSPITNVSTLLKRSQIRKYGRDRPVNFN